MKISKQKTALTHPYAVVLRYGATNRFDSLPKAKAYLIGVLDRWSDWTMKFARDSAEDVADLRAQVDAISQDTLTRFGRAIVSGFVDRHTNTKFHATIQYEGD